MSEIVEPEPLAPWQAVHRSFLGALRDLAADGAKLTAALGTGTVEHMVNAVLARTCETQALQLTDYLRHIEHDRRAQRQLDVAMRALLQAPAVLELRRPTQLQEIHRELQLLCYALSGEEPAAELWSQLDEAERGKVRAAVETMRGTDGPLLERVRKALARKERFGSCEACAKPIPVGRLQLVAAAERCAPCQAQLDQAGAQALPECAARVVTFERAAKA